MANEKNLKPAWKKGESGNPAGRPAIVTDIKNYLQERLAEPASSGSDATKLEALVSKLLSMAYKGNMKAMELALSYGYGKPRQAIDVTTDETLIPISKIEIIHTNSKPIT